MTLFGIETLCYDWVLSSWMNETARAVYDFDEPAYWWIWSDLEFDF